MTGLAFRTVASASYYCQQSNDGIGARWTSDRIAGRPGGGGWGSWCRTTSRWTVRSGGGRPAGRTSSSRAPARSHGPARSRTAPRPPPAAPRPTRDPVGGPPCPHPIVRLLTIVRCTGYRAKRKARHDHRRGSLCRCRGWPCWPIVTFPPNLDEITRFCEVRTAGADDLPTALVGAEVLLTSDPDPGAGRRVGGRGPAALGAHRQRRSRQRAHRRGRGERCDGDELPWSVRRAPRRVRPGPGAGVHQGSSRDLGPAATPGMAAPGHRARGILDGRDRRRGRGRSYDRPAAARRRRAGTWRRPHRPRWRARLRRHQRLRRHAPVVYREAELGRARRTPDRTDPQDAGRGRARRHACERPVDQRRARRARRRGTRWRPRSGRAPSPGPRSTCSSGSRCRRPHRCGICQASSCPRTWRPTPSAGGSNWASCSSTTSGAGAPGSRCTTSWTRPSATSRPPPAWRRGTDFADWTASELVAAYARRAVSPVEVTRSVLDRIGKRDPDLNAFCFVDEQVALDQAARSEERWRTGTPDGPVDGVPTSIKDLFLTRGWPTLRGSRTIDPHQESAEDAPSVARLRESGAVLLGKTTTPELGWKGVTDGPLRGSPAIPGTDRGPPAGPAAARPSPAPGWAPRPRHRRGRLDPHPGRFMRDRRLSRPGRVPLARQPLRPLAHADHGPHRHRHRLILDVLSRPDPRDGRARRATTWFREHLAGAWTG